MSTKSIPRLRSEGSIEVGTSYLMLSPDLKVFSTSDEIPEVKSSTSSAGSNPAGLTSSRSSFLIRDLNARRLSTPDNAGKSLVLEG